MNFVDCLAGTFQSGNSCPCNATLFHSLIVVGQRVPRERFLLPVQRPVLRVARASINPALTALIASTDRSQLASNPRAHVGVFTILRIDSFRSVHSWQSFDRQSSELRRL